MTNPFDTIDGRLDTIEELLQKLLQQRNTPVETANIGGIQLAEEILCLSKARIYALVSARILPHSKKGNRLFFSRLELLNWVAAGKRDQTK